MVAHDLIWTWNEKHQTWTVHPVEDDNEPKGNDFLAALNGKVGQ